MSQFKFNPIKLKAPSPSTENSLKGVFDVIFGVTLVSATLPLIGAASS